MNDNAPSWVEAVTLAEIVRQRSLGWPDFHPEDFCHYCGRRNPVWTAESETWFEAFPEARGSDGGGVWCPSCFAVKHAEMTGQDRTIWSLAVWTDPNLPSTSDKEAPSKVWRCGRCGERPEAHADSESSCIYEPMLMPAAAVPVVPEEPAATECEILHPVCLAHPGVCWPVSERCEICPEPAPVADVEPQPAGYWRVDDGEIEYVNADGYCYELAEIHHPGTPYNTAVAAKAALRKLLAASSAPDVLRMPTEVQAAWIIETALTEWAAGQDEAADDCAHVAGRTELRRQASVARSFAEAVARSASGSTEA